MRHTGAGLEQLHRQSVPLRLDDVLCGAATGFCQLLAGGRRALLGGGTGHATQVLVTFKQLDGEQSRGQAMLVRQVWFEPRRKVGDHRFRIAMVAEAARRHRGVAGQVQCCLKQLMDTHALSGHCSDDWNTELAGKLLAVDMNALAMSLVHHVQTNHDRQSEFHELQCQLQAPRQHRRVNDIDDGIDLLLEQKVARRRFGGRGGSQGVGAR